MIIGVLICVGFVGFVGWLIAQGVSAASSDPTSDRDPLPLSPAERQHLERLGFSILTGDLWSRHTGGPLGSVTYSQPDGGQRTHRLWIDPKQPKPVTAPSGLDLEARAPGSDTRGLTANQLLDGVAGLVVTAYTVEEEGETLRQAPLAPADVARCQRLFDAELAALLAAVPGGSVAIKVEDPTSYEVWVKWPAQGQDSGLHVEAAQRLLLALDARLHAPVPEPT